MDDDPIALAILETTLNCAGHTDLTTASSGASALARMAGGTGFECFLFDIQMPGMGGIELCRHVREVEAYRRTPVIMISAMTDRAVIDQAFKAGATDYVNKPFDPLELVVRIGMAERMALQEAHERSSRDRLDFLRARLGLGEQVELEDAFALRGIPTMISPVELENVLLRMPRMKAWRSGFYTVRILDVERHFEDLSGEAFYDLVADVGTAVADALARWPHVVSYIGWGAFTAIVEGLSRPGSGALTEAIHQEMRALGFKVDGGEEFHAVEVDGPAPVVGLLMSPAHLPSLSRIPLR